MHSRQAEKAIEAAFYTQDWLWNQDFGDDEYADAIGELVVGRDLALGTVVRAFSKVLHGRELASKYAGGATDWLFLWMTTMSPDIQAAAALPIAAGRALCAGAFARLGGSVTPTSAFRTSRTGLDSTKVTAKGIARIERHLYNTPGITPGEAELTMVTRLKQGYRTPQDLRFYQHELMESRIIGKYQRLGYEDIDAARFAHFETLQRQGLYYHGFESELYVPGSLP